MLHTSWRYDPLHRSCFCHHNRSPQQRTSVAESCRVSNQLPPEDAPQNRGIYPGCQDRTEGRFDDMDLKLELVLGLRALLALLVGGFMGWDRRHVRPTAGVR